MIFVLWLTSIGKIFLFYRAVPRELYVYIETCVSSLLGDITLYFF